MKKFKTFIACFLAAATLSCTLTSLPSAFASEIKTDILPVGIDVECTAPYYYIIHQFGSLDEVIKEHYGENVIVKKPDAMLNGCGAKSNSKYAFVLTEDCEVHLLFANYCRIVKMKEGTFPQVEKVRDLLHPDFYYPDFVQLKDDESAFLINFYEDSPANEILLNDENVVSIEETFYVYEDSDRISDLGIIGQISCISGITMDELFDEYGDVFNLSVPVELESGYLPDGVYCKLEKSEETYNALKKLFESDVDFILDTNLYSSVNPGISFTPDDLMAPAEDYVIGDINEDGAVDLTDLSELSLSVLGDSTLSEEQITAADIDGDGDLTVADLSRLKQYVSNQISSLR